MLKKILKILAKITAGAVLFYLVAGFIILPLVLYFFIPYQGGKLFQTQVKVRSVAFNPLMLTAQLRGLEIFDREQQLAVGFERLFVDVSFRALLRKIYRIESFEIDGLIISAVLRPDGEVNLLALVPQGSDSIQPDAGPDDERSADADQDEPASPDEPAQTEALPLVIADEIIVRRGEVRFTDRSVQPAFSTVLSDMELKITGFSTDPQSETRLTFEATLDQRGSIAVEAVMLPLAEPLAMEMSFSLNDYALGVLSPYVGKYTGRVLDDGRLTVTMDYRIHDDQLIASHRLFIQHFKFGQRVESADALNLPFGLAVALLQDPQGRINIALPVNGDMSDPQFEYLHIVGQVIRNFFLRIVTRPFAALASMMTGAETGTDELGFVRFLSGKSDLSAEEREKLDQLMNGLNERPGLRLEINGTYDPAIDWKAIQEEMFLKDYEELRGVSSRSEVEVHAMLYQRRFGIRALWDLARDYKERVGEYDDVKLSAEIRRQLVEHAPPDPVALRGLGQRRAQRVYDVFAAGGFDTGRLRIGPVRQAQGSMGYVPLEFTLTVFEQAEGQGSQEE